MADITTGATPETTSSTSAAGDTSLTAFFKDMSVQEKRTFCGCFGGWSLDGMDFMIFPLVLGTLLTLWDLDRGSAGIVTTLTILTSSVGGWIGGYYADRIGRVRMIKLTILWFSFFSVLCAFAQDFTQLAIYRACWASASAPSGRRVRSLSVRP